MMKHPAADTGKSFVRSAGDRAAIVQKQRAHRLAIRIERIANTDFNRSAGHPDRTAEIQNRVFRSRVFQKFQRPVKRIALGDPAEINGPSSFELHTVSEKPDAIRSGVPQRL